MVSCFNLIYKRGDKNPKINGRDGSKAEHTLFLSSSRAQTKDLASAFDKTALPVKFATLSNPFIDSFSKNF